MKTFKDIENLSDKLEPIMLQLRSLSIEEKKAIEYYVNILLSTPDVQYSKY